MKSILLGFLAAVIGCIIFFLCLAGWYEMTGQGSGVAKRPSADGSGTVVVVSQDSGNASQEAAGSGTGTGSASQETGTASQGTGSASGSGTGTGSASQGTAGSGTGTDSGIESAGASSGAGTSSAQSPGTVSETAINDYMKTIETELSAGLDDSTHLKVERSARGITITLWEDDLVTKLSEGQRDNSTEELWQEKKDRLQQISKTYADKSASAGVTNAHIVANLLNERNQEDIILSYQDGTLIHDGLDHN